MRAELRDQVVAEIRAYAAELADPYRTQVATYTKTRGGRIKLVGVHTEMHDGLLTQMADAAAYGVTSSEDTPGARPVPQSRPPGAWEPLARHTEIVRSAARWCCELRLPLRETVHGNVRQLAGAAGARRVVDDIMVELLAQSMRRWRAQAQAMIGWTTEAYRPRATCPILTCGRAGTLRVNLARRAAFCVECLSVWDDVDGSINVLAEHIAAQTEARAVTTERIRSGWSGHGAWLGDHPIG